MQSSSNTYAADLGARQRAVVEADAASTADVQLGIPLLLFGLGLYAAEHDTFYASPAFAERSVDVDLAASVGGSNFTRQLGYLTIGVVGAAWLLRRSSVAVSLDYRLLFLSLVACAWLLLSALWADNFSLSLKRIFIPLLIFAGAMGVAKHWRPRQACLFIAALSAGFLLFGVATECAYGTFLRGPDYRFAGTLFPNNQAITCAALCLAAASLSCGSLSQPRTAARRIWLIPFFIGLALLLLTGSRTATASFLVALFVFWIMGASVQTKWWAAGGLLVMAACLGVIISENQERSGQSLVEIVKMGRQQEVEDVQSLTGRIPIWTEVLHDIAKHPWVGYGYGAFWTTQRVVQYSYIHKWEFNHAHSAYLETILNVGVMGLILGLLIPLLACRSAVRAYRHTADVSYRFFVAALVMMLVHGFLDSNFVRGGFASMLAAICVAMMIFHRESVPDA